MRMLRWVWECILREAEPIMFFFFRLDPGILFLGWSELGM